MYTLDLSTIAISLLRLSLLTAHLNLITLITLISLSLLIILVIILLIILLIITLGNALSTFALIPNTRTVYVGQVIFRARNIIKKSPSPNLILLLIVNRKNACCIFRFLARAPTIFTLDVALNTLAFQTLLTQALTTVALTLSTNRFARFNI